MPVTYDVSVYLDSPTAKLRFKSGLPEAHGLTATAVHVYHDGTETARFHLCGFDVQEQALKAIARQAMAKLQARMEVVHTSRLDDDYELVIKTDGDGFCWHIHALDEQGDLYASYSNGQWHDSVAAATADAHIYRLTELDSE